VLLKCEFEPSGRTYGSRRLQRQLAHQGVRVGFHRVRSLMKEMQITAIWKRQFINSTDSRHNLSVVENSLNRNFKPILPILVFVIISFI
jgi:putative transposase